MWMKFISKKKKHTRVHRLGYNFYIVLILRGASFRNICSAIFNSVTGDRKPVKFRNKSEGNEFLMLKIDKPGFF